MDEFDRFYQRHVGLVFAAALARTAERCQAEDLTQETMLRAWRHFAELLGRDTNGQRAWLLATLRHRAIEAWRKEKPTTPLPETLPLAEDDPVPLRLDVARALAAMDPIDREMIVLRYFEQLDSPQIGAILGMPDGTVRRRLAQARQALAQRLEGERA